jgi:hypothetical protein
MDMPDFEKYRYIVVEDGDQLLAKAYWIESKGRLIAASQSETDAERRSGWEKIESPGTIGLNYQGLKPMSVYRVSKLRHQVVH